MIPGAKELAWGQIGGGAHEKKAARLACRPKSQKTVVAQRTRLLSLFCVPLGVDRSEAVPLFR